MLSPSGSNFDGLYFSENVGSARVMYVKVGTSGTHHQFLRNKIAKVLNAYFPIQVHPIHGTGLFVLVVGGSPKLFGTHIIQRDVCAKSRRTPPNQYGDLHPAHVPQIDRQTFEWSSLSQQTHV